MSSESLISAEHLGKCYQLYTTPSDRLKQFIFPRIRKLVGLQPRLYYRQFWALQDVSFSLGKGETIGIIGRNGSGKSTLLQMLCGTLHPTTGTVMTSGRIAALLELGAGFNPEFTGRENVYLNASIFGLSKSRTDERFAEIAAFADIGEFIDQPVKSYSSGMFVRLAFAVIAHVDADILVIDEALAVGDALFTQKCMRFLRRFMETGTVIFVSHDMSSVVNLCDRAIWLHEGRIREIGDAKSVAESYLQYTLQETYGNQVELQAVGAERGGATGQSAESVQETICTDTKVHFFDRLSLSEGWETGKARIESVSVENASGEAVSSLHGGEDICIVIRAKCFDALASPIIGWYLKDRLGQALFGEHTQGYMTKPLLAKPGELLEARFRFRLPLLPNGDYSLAVALADGTAEENIQHHWVHDALLIRVSSEKLRYGLVGISFASVSMRLVAQ